MLKDTQRSGQAGVRTHDFGLRVGRAKDTQHSDQAGVRTHDFGLRVGRAKDTQHSDQAGVRTHDFGLRVGHTNHSTTHRSARRDVLTKTKECGMLFS